MKNSDLPKYWNALLRWRGWRSMAAFCTRAWHDTLRWSGWKTLFSLSVPLTLLLNAACAAGLIWVFVHGLEAWVPAYFLYALSTYSLAALCARLPAIVRGVKAWFFRHPQLAGLLKNRELRFKLGLYFEQLLNFIYGIFKITSGVILGSAWVGCDGIYNFVQSMIQLFQILRRNHAETLIQQWQSYRSCGFLILLMHLTLTGIVFQTISWNRSADYGTIMVIITAFFVFYKITRSFFVIARDRKHIRPVDSSIRMLDLAQAIFAVFSLQANMVHTFGTGKSWEQLLNTITGCTVCFLIVSIGVYMIHRANREINKIKETGYGEQSAL